MLTAVANEQKNDAATFSVGIEEEFFLVDAQTLACVSMMPAAFESEAKAALGRHFAREIHASMIELISSPHTSIGALNAEIAGLRATASTIARRHGLALLACGTHPFSDWRTPERSPGQRYDEVGADLQMISARGHACGLHVHVRVPDGCRVGVMSRIQQFLPILLALSTSSPFWLGENTGLKSYRTALNSESPRSGLPGPIASEAEFRNLVRALKSAGLIRDESYLWWFVRPSRRHPTLELRVCDCCPDVRDTLAIASLYRALVHALAVDSNFCAATEPWRQVLTAENMWQALRHGLDARFINPDTLKPVDAHEALAQIVSLVGGSARSLGIERDVKSTLDIIDRGTSADRQLAAYAAGTEREVDGSACLHAAAACVLVC